MIELTRDGQKILINESKIVLIRSSKSSDKSEIYFNFSVTFSPHDYLLVDESYDEIKQNIATKVVWLDDGKGLAVMDFGKLNFHV